MVKHSMNIEHPNRILSIVFILYPHYAFVTVLPLVLPPIQQDQWQLLRQEGEVK